MRTTAVRDGACWVLNGSKMFITHGTSADTLVVMAVTDKSKGACAPAKPPRSSCRIAASRPPR
jgi:alkylation response protein AidB-like acyl-CoA dehydrogenase